MELFKTNQGHQGPSKQQTVYFYHNSTYLWHNGTQCDCCCRGSHTLRIFTSRGNLGEKIKRQKDDCGLMYQLTNSQICELKSNTQNAVHHLNIQRYVRVQNGRTINTFTQETFISTILLPHSQKIIFNRCDSCEFRVKHSAKQNNVPLFNTWHHDDLRILWSLKNICTIKIIKCFCSH